MTATALTVGRRGYHHSPRVVYDRYNPVGLTDRERECLGHILSGLKNREIAVAMDNISKKTVNMFREAIYQKLGVHSILDLARACIYHDYIDLMSFLKPLNALPSWTKQQNKL